MEEIKDLKRKTLISLIWKYAEKTGSQFISFIVSVVLARILSPDDYGTIAIISIFISLMQVFVSGGLANALIQCKKVNSKDYNTMFTTCFVVSIILYVALYFSAPFISNLYNKPELIDLIRVSGVTLIISSVTCIQHAYVSRKLIFKKFFYSTLIGTVISGIVGIIMAVNNFGVWALISQSILKAIADLLVLHFTIDLRLKFGFYRKSFKKLFSFGFKLMVTNFIGNFFNQLKYFIIGTKYNSTDLAYSTKGEQIPSVIVSNVNSTIESVLFPSISKLNDNLDIMKKAVKRAIKVSTFVIMPIVFGVLACASNIVEIVYTSKWNPIVPYLQLLCFQYSFSILGSVNLQVINARGRSDISLKLEFIKKPLFIAMIILGMMKGPYYIVLANAIYSVIGVIINAIPNKKLINYGFIEQFLDIVPNLCCSLIMMLVVILIGNININIYLCLFIQIIIGAVIYLGIQRVFKNESLDLILDYIKRFFNKLLKKGDIDASKI